MPQAQPIILVDNEASNVTFTPNNRTSNGDFHFLNVGSGQSNLADHLVLRAIAATSGTSKTYLKLEAIKPVTDSDTGLTAPGGKAIVELNIKFPSNFTADDRARAYSLVASSLDDATVSSVLRDVQGIY